MGISGQIDGIVAARNKLIEMLASAANEAQQSGKLAAVTLPEAALERPQNSDHGDYASSFPLKLARAARANPMAIASELVNIMQPDCQIADITAAAPGFINFTLKTDWLTAQVNSILAAGQTYGNSQKGQGSSL